MTDIDQIPRNKRSFKTSEVCQLTDTQPYVLRFWESEFPQLSPARGRGGQPVYRREDIDLVLRIKQLLYDEEYTIDGARKRLEQELTGDAAPRRAAVTEIRDEIPPLSVESGAAAASDDLDTVPRQRYEDAVEEVDLLRLKIREAEANLRRTEARAQKAEEIADRHRKRAHLALSRIEKLLDSLG